METPREKFLICFCMLLILFGSFESHPLQASGTPKTKQCSHNIGRERLVGPISPFTRDWLEKELQAGRCVILTNAYLFQVMKGIAQENQKRAEQEILAPLLRNTLIELVKTAKDPDTRRLFAVPLVILDGENIVNVSTEIRNQAAEINRNSMFSPRGHYSDSEDLQRYFRAMQYLARATVDVSIRPDYFPYPKEMLYPLQTVRHVRDVFAAPPNRRLLNQWMMIHSFYDEINGPADLPTFADVVTAFKNKTLTKDYIQEWAKAKSLPRINRERGLGIQPMGERFSLHEAVIDSFKVKLFREDTPREQMAEMLSFSNLLAGLRGRKGRISGIAEIMETDKGISYYSTVLKAIRLGAKGWKYDTMHLNFFAASLTALVEQTALMTKTSIIVQKSQSMEPIMPKGLKLDFEPDSQRYLNALADASSAMVRLCKSLRSGAPEDRGAVLEPNDVSQTMRVFAELSKASKPLITGTPLWETHGKYILSLARKPAVTVDVFQHRDRSGHTSFYQWAIAPFKVVYGTKSDGSGRSGLEMVFIQAWNDDIIRGAEGPVNNLEWESRILEGNLNRLNPLIALPQVKEVD